VTGVTRVTPEPGGTDAPDRRSPGLFRLALAVFAVEAGLVWLYVGYLGFADLTQAAGDTRRAALVTAYFGGYALAYAAVGRALWRRRAWARAPAIVLQLLLAALGYVMIGGGAPALGVPVLVVALFGAGLLLAPASREALTAGRGPLR
jgi:hypothetical protein